MTAIIYFGEMLAASLLAIVLLAISQLGMNYEALLFASGVRGHEPAGVFCFQMPRQDCGIAMGPHQQRAVRKASKKQWYLNPL
jgi:hypothetical protein